MRRAIPSRRVEQGRDRSEAARPELTSGMRRGSVAALVAAAVLAFPAAAQEADAVTQANNPLADMTAFNIHNYYVGNLSTIDRPGNQVWLRYAKPFSLGATDWLFRGSLPYLSMSLPGGDRDHGIGDLNGFAAYIVDTGRPGVSFGIGPQFTLPTASEDSLGWGKYALGVANMLFVGASKTVQWGYLFTWQASVAGDGDRDDVNLATFQPIGLYQLGQGWYLRSTGTWTFDLEHDTHSMPVGLGVGRVIPTPGVVYNAFTEPQYSIDTRGDFQPEWQIFAGLNLQFPN